MEAETETVVEQASPTVLDEDGTPWVSPEIAAAQAGECVELGKNIEAMPEEA